MLYLTTRSLALNLRRVDAQIVLVPGPWVGDAIRSELQLGEALAGTVLLAVPLGSILVIAVLGLGIAAFGRRQFASVDR